MTTVNAAKIPIIAIDVPSGLNCETGLPEGAAIEATLTLTVGAPKKGMLAQSAWEYVGRLEVLEDVGLVPCPITSEWNWTMPDDFENFPPRRPEAGHKGTNGHVAIIAGSFGFHGASVLAARAAQRTQPGLVTLFTDAMVYPVVAPQFQAVMVGIFKPDMKFPDSATADSRRAWHACARCGRRHEENRAATLAGFGIADGRGRQRARLAGRKSIAEGRDPSHHLASGRSSADAQCHDEAGPGRPPPGVARTVQKIWNCWVVLKGHQTLIGRAEGDIFVNSSGNAFLGQGGSGDVLGGYVAGLLAQPALQKDVFKTIRFAVWQHGAAADVLQEKEKTWVVEDLISELGNAR